MSLSCFVSLDAIVHDIGSSATLGNTSNSPETGGAYVIPTAMMTKDGYILAWELVASKLGPIRLQVSFQGTLVPALPWWSSPSLYSEKNPNESLIGGSSSPVPLQVYYYN